MPTRLGLRDTLEGYDGNFVQFFFDALVQDNSKTPYTNIVLGLITGIFLVEVTLALLYTAGNTYVVVIGFFKNLTWLAWAIAPLLHRGLGHFAANAAFIYIAGPVEEHLSRRQYIALLLFSGYLPVYADGLKLSFFGSEPNVAVMGASGFGLGLLGFGMATHIGSDWRLTPRWWLIVMVGIAGILLILQNALIAFSDPISLHLGHLGGLLVGFVFGYLNRI